MVACIPSITKSPVLVFRGVSYRGGILRLLPDSRDLEHAVIDFAHKFRINVFDFHSSTTDAHGDQNDYIRDCSARNESRADASEV